MHALFLAMMMWVRPGCGTAGDIVLVENGQARHTIVLPADASPAETRAATVLQQYVQKISGAQPALSRENAWKQQRPAIFIGHTSASEKFEGEKIAGEGFFIATDDQHLYIRGGSGKGVIYGVYTLLETYFGCRKFSAGPAYVPHKPTLTVRPQRMDRQEPRFVYRETYYPAPLDPEYQEWHKLHSFEDLWGVWGHSYFKMVPPKTYFEAHPEYFAFVNGKRRATQLCLSNADVERIATEYLRKAMADNPDALYWSISPEDGTGYCTCDQCAQADKEEGSHAGSLIRFVNRIAAQFPDKQFTTLAYTYTLQPPAQTRPAANVFIMLSSIDAYRHQPLEKEPSAAGFRKALQDWRKVTGNIFVWDYTTQFTHYLAPFPDYFLLQQNLQFFAGNGVKGVFSQGSGHTYADMAELNAYLQAKALWQPQQATDTAFGQFMRGYYGKAGQPLAQYLEALAAHLRTANVPLDIYGNPVNNRHDFLSPAAIEQYSRLLDEAEKAVEGNAQFSERVYNARLPLEYTVLQQARLYGTDKHGYLVPSGNGYAPAPQWAGRVERFVRQANRAGVKELSEGGLAPDAYLQEWQTLLARPWTPSLAFGKKVTLLHPFTPEYTAKKEATLTDGLTGGADFALNWLFVYGNDLVATIDLGGRKDIRKVKINFLQDARHNIFLPTHLLVETSADGQAWQTMSRQAIPPAEEEDFSARVAPFQPDVQPTSARFLRVTAKCLTDMPDWRGNNKKPAICADEIVVQ